jgi:hypothetical protein
MQGPAHNRARLNPIPKIGWLQLLKTCSAYEPRKRVALNGTGYVQTTRLDDNESICAASKSGGRIETS